MTAKTKKYSPQNLTKLCRRVAMKVVNIWCQGIFIGMRLSELIPRDIIYLPYSIVTEPDSGKRSRYVTWCYKARYICVFAFTCRCRNPGRRENILCQWLDFTGNEIHLISLFLNLIEYDKWYFFLAVYDYLHMHMVPLCS